MYPILLVIGPLTIYSFGFMIAVAVIVCSYFMGRDAQRQGISKDVVYDFMFWATLSGVLGSRLFYVLLNLEYFIEAPMELFKLNNGGLAWQGGLITGLLVAILYLRIKKLKILNFLDLVAPYAALGQAIGRIGCFLNGCCFGQPLTWGVYFPVHKANLHPTQLYESLGLLIVFFVLKKINRMGRAKGSTLICYLMAASVLRFLVQFVRYDYEPFFLGLGIFQWNCVFVFIIAVGVLLFVNNKNKSHV